MRRYEVITLVSALTTTHTFSGIELGFTLCYLALEPTEVEF